MFRSLRVTLYVSIPLCFSVSCLSPDLQEVLDDSVRVVANSGIDEKSDFLHQAESAKARGNELFAQKNYAGTLESYTLALVHVESALRGGEELVRAQALRRTVLANRAMAYLSLLRWQDAKLDCEAVLREEPNHQKCLYRFVVAATNLGEKSEAVHEAYFKLDEESKRALSDSIIKNLEPQSYQVWVPELTNEFINNVNGWSRLIEYMLRSELHLDDASQEILEIGSGPNGGILQYVGDLPNVTPSEPNSDSFKVLKNKFSRAIQATAQAMPFVVGDRKFDIVVISNAMDCIMSESQKDGPEALSAIKRVLKPGGKIVVLQYYNPSTDLIQRLINQRAPKFVGLPSWEDRTEQDGSLFPQPGVAFVKREALTLPSLRFIIEKHYNNKDQTLLLSDPGMVFRTLLVDHSDVFRTIAQEVIEIEEFNDESNPHGVEWISMLSLFLEQLERDALTAGMRSVAKEVLVEEEVAAGQGQQLWYSFSRVCYGNKNSVRYTVVEIQ